jgi:membrane-associated phospholipid phosphatase
VIQPERIKNSNRDTGHHPASDREYLASRREFLSRIPGAAAITLASAALPVVRPAQAGMSASSNGAAVRRVVDSFQNRLDAAEAEAQVPIPQQITNGDEQTYPNFIGNYSKGLPHNNLGEVSQSAYLSLLNAVGQGTAAAFEQVPLGGTGAPAPVKLVNPLSGVAFDLEGTDSHQFAIPPFPSVASRALADQAVELYWMALCRDVNFLDYGSNPLTLAAAAELSSLRSFDGPKSGGAVTPQSLFRGFTPQDMIGPYVSQFLLRPFNYGPYAMSGMMSMYVPGIDYVTDQASWLAVQNGQGPFASNVLGAVRFTCTGRDLTVYVHSDPNAGLMISFYNAGIWLFEQNAPLNPGNPYIKYAKQVGFATFGTPHFLCLLGEAKQRACKAAWYAKWFVHRALRPEEYGGLAHMTATGKAHYPLQGDILNSKALAAVFSKNGTYFLPQAFPEGCPQHPSYPQGHATMAGACATILKATFDGSVQFNTLSNGAIMTASEDGTSLIPYTGSDANQITVNGEINKLASNIGQARDFAGIHWRSDYMAGLLLGEAAALSVLNDQSNNYVGEDFDGFVITKFDGTSVTV